MGSSEAANEFLRTLKLDVSKIQYLQVDLVNGSRGLSVNITNRPGYPTIRVRQVCKDFVKYVSPKTAEDMRVLGRWLDMGDE